MIQPLADRFWEKVDRPQGDTACWVWTGYRNAKGYGIFNAGGRNQPAHRVAFELERSPIPAGIWVLHHCDNPPCVRPDHLWLGTNTDNMRDAASKGRSGAQVHPELMARGGMLPQSRLTAETVRAIRIAAAQGEFHRVLARRYGVA